MKLSALIPARANSKRLPGKNTRDLAGHPLIEYTIAAAQQAGVFSQIVVASDSEDTLRLVEQLDGRVTCYLRNFSHDAEPDIQWVSQVLDRSPNDWDAFSLLRPTSPFRTAETIKRAWEQFLATNHGTIDSLRAVEPVRHHPAKMWRLGPSGMMCPLLLQPEAPQTPWHSQPAQNLPKVYVQNASLEIAWTDTVRRTGTIAGDRILAFETQGHEGLDINEERDWVWALYLIATGQATLPEVNVRMAEYAGSDPT